MAFEYTWGPWITPATQYEEVEGLAQESVSAIASYFEGAGSPTESTGTSGVASYSEGFTFPLAGGYESAQRSSVVFDLRTRRNHIYEPDLAPGEFPGYYPTVDDVTAAYAAFPRPEGVFPNDWRFGGVEFETPNPLNLSTGDSVESGEFYFEMTGSFSAYGLPAPVELKFTLMTAASGGGEMPGGVPPMMADNGSYLTADVSNGDVRWGDVESSLAPADVVSEDMMVAAGVPFTLGVHTTDSAEMPWLKYWVGYRYEFTGLWIGTHLTYPKALGDPGCGVSYNGGSYFDHRAFVGYTPSRWRVGYYRTPVPVPPVLTAEGDVARVVFMGSRD